MRKTGRISSGCRILLSLLVASGCGELLDIPYMRPPIDGGASDAMASGDGRIDGDGETGSGSDAAACRDKLLLPFASDSPWNTPIGANATFEAAQLTNLLQYYNEDELIVLASDAPLRPLNDFNSWWTGSSTCGLGGAKQLVPVPDGLVLPSPTGSDYPNRAGGVLLSDGVTIQDFQYASRCDPTGPLTAGAVANRCTYDIRGSGVGCFGAHGGSGLTGVGGSLRACEIDDSCTTKGPIRHALKLTLSVAHLSGARFGYRWPALAADAGWDDQASTQGYKGSVLSLEMGSLLAVPRSLDCESFVSQLVARRVCHALQDYGGYVVDSHPTVPGWRPFGIATEFAASAMMNVASTELLTLAQQLVVVTNSGPTSVGGGGAPVVPLSPPLCGSPRDGGTTPAGS